MSREQFETEDEYAADRYSCCLADSPCILWFWNLWNLCSAIGYAVHHFPQNDQPGNQALTGIYVTTVVLNWIQFAYGFFAYPVQEKEAPTPLSIISNLCVFLPNLVFGATLHHLVKDNDKCYKRISDSESHDERAKDLCSQLKVFTYFHLVFTSLFLTWALSTVIIWLRLRPMRRAERQEIIESA